MSLRDIILWFMPPAMKVDAEADSRKWVATCPRCQAESSVLRVSRSLIRRSRHCRVSAESSISAMLSHDPCLGVWWISRRWARAKASSGSNASYSEAMVWVLRLSITSTRTSASG